MHTSVPDASPKGSSPLSALDIRPLRTDTELQACVELQRETWGREFDDVVPPSILKVVQRIGGVAGGAFDAGGRLVGFVFGITGVERGHIVHWSDMLAVRAEVRDAGVGRRLKAWQREQARAAGAETMYWTYDPLVARNAYLNFNRLGVRLTEYVEDMYGTSTSDLHRGLGTDRFVVAWPLGRAPALPDERTLAAAADAPVLNDAPEALGARPRWALVAVPSDIIAVRERDPAAAARWRAATRRAFQEALAAGYGVRGFLPGAGVGHYVLEPGA